MNCLILGAVIGLIIGSIIKVSILKKKNNESGIKMGILMDWQQLSNRIKLLPPVKRWQFSSNMMLWGVRLVVFLLAIGILLISLIYIICFILYKFNIKILPSSVDLICHYIGNIGLVVYFYLGLTKIPNDKKLLKKLEELENSVLK
jgi:hypothetical protein